MYQPVLVGEHHRLHPVPRRRSGEGEPGPDGEAASVTRGRLELTAEHRRSLTHPDQPVAGALVFCAATAIVAFRTRALPRWLAVGAAVTAAALAVNGAFVGTGSVPALLLFLLWTLLASVHLLRRTWRVPAPAAAAEAVAHV